MVLDWSVNMLDFHPLVSLSLDLEIEEPKEVHSLLLDVTSTSGNRVEWHIRGAIPVVMKPPARRTKSRSAEAEASSDSINVDGKSGSENDSLYSDVESNFDDQESEQKVRPHTHFHIVLFQPRAVSKLDAARPSA